MATPFGYLNNANTTTATRTKIPNFSELPRLKALSAGNGILLDATGKISTKAFIGISYSNINENEVSQFELSKYPLTNYHLVSFMFIDKGNDSLISMTMYGNMFTSKSKITCIGLNGKSTTLTYSQGNFTVSYIQGNDNKKLIPYGIVVYKLY